MKGVLLFFKISSEKEHPRTLPRVFNVKFRLFYARVIAEI